LAQNPTTPIPNPQSPIPNPQLEIKKIIIYFITKINNNNNFII